ncbi:MAG: AIR synthase-related protein [Nanoarchaeota archaeon]
MVLRYDKRESFAVSKIKEAIPQWLLRDRTGLQGLFADLHQNDEVFPNHLLASSVDGVGTKLLIAEAMGVHDTIGIDLVAMNVNDLATLGKVSPFLFINYIACQERIEEEGITGSIMSGIVKGLEQSDASGILTQNIRLNMGKGETASVDELLGGLREGYGFDVAAAMVGFIRKEDLRQPGGDTLIAFESSGPHSNGFTELRHLLLKGDFEARERFRRHYRGRFSLDDEYEGKTIGRWLLEPTKIYLRAMAAIAKEHPVFGLNNTGYGLKNLTRITTHDFRLRKVLEPQPIFKLLKKESGYSDEKLYSTFNMGMGFFVMCQKQDADSILSIAARHGVRGEVIGAIGPGAGKVSVESLGLAFERYA